jgi:glucan phosphorylase
LIGALKVDWYLVSDDFGSYLDANKLVDEAYKDQDSWAEKYPLLQMRILTVGQF